MYGNCEICYSIKCQLIVIKYVIDNLAYFIIYCIAMYGFESYSGLSIEIYFIIKLEIQFS